MWWLKHLPDSLDYPGDEEMSMLLRRCNLREARIRALRRRRRMVAILVCVAALSFWGAAIWAWR